MRRAVAAIMGSAWPSCSRCFGVSTRDSGQSLDPIPPPRMTGTMGAACSQDASARSACSDWISNSIVDARCICLPRGHGALGPSIGWEGEMAVCHPPLPCERAPNDRVESVAPRPPPEQAGEPVGVRDHHRRVARPPRRLAHLEGPPMDALDGRQDLAHGVSAPVAAIQDEALATLLKTAQRENVDVGKIADMDEV